MKCKYCGQPIHVRIPKDFDGFNMRWVHLNGAFSCMTDATPEDEVMIPKRNLMGNLRKLLENTDNTDIEFPAQLEGLMDEIFHTLLLWLQEEDKAIQDETRELLGDADNG